MRAQDVEFEDHDRLVDQVLARWRLHGESARVVGWEELIPDLTAESLSSSNATVVVANTHEIECVLSSAIELTTLKVVLASVLERGWEVNVLTEVASLGQAHEHLRGLSVTLQGWRMSSGENPWFSAREIA